MGLSSFYFDGCSNTWGAELENPEVSRYSRLVCDHFGVDEHNIAQRGKSDKRVLRNLLETDLSPYDCVIVQLTCKNRTEYWNERKNTWKTVRNPAKRNYWEALDDSKQFWHYYWKNFYTDKLGDINQLTYYHAIRNILKDKKHLIIGIAGWGQTVRAPVDINFTEYSTAFRGHPDENAQKEIAETIIKYIESKY
tara:strand:+ start:55 stop:636 length:582 start_codon:yes stop_codon:yes gene_type:complete